MAQRRTMAGIAAEETEDGFVIHIVDDAAEVFEIEASRENVELMVANLSAVLGGGSGEDSHAED
ncbi:hypothetical protein [Aureimonas psammosilenae]|uniref:hypothetical protein n=1 Tax=Aureimonas psammosilenae TaxID=2495496 RepID=UPI00126066EA|nr:hypothetical protein [Aureimonas psammosilenae]